MNKTKNEEYKNAFEQKQNKINMPTQPQVTSAQTNPTTNQRKTNFANKPFTSKYLNDSGKWSIKAVDDGFVGFDDYIGDIKDESATYPSYNNKKFRVSDYDIKAKEEKNYKEGDVLENGKDEKTPHKQEEPPFLNEESSILWTIMGVQQAAKAAKKAGPKVDDFILGMLENTKGTVGSFAWAKRHLGEDIAKKGGYYASTTSQKAIDKAIEWGLDNVHNNKGDAYRHFMWNAEMTRDPEVGYYHARNITNRHEYENMRDYNWLDSDCGEFDHLKNNTIIKGKMNQESFMDLWNNQVGRELAHNKDFQDKTEEELFKYAIENNLLITDANSVYEFLGIDEYRLPGKEYTVPVEWNLTTGDVTVKKDGKSVTLKIGV